MREHDAEPVLGLPGRLPEGERVLWQGAPCWRALALRAYHVRALALYFVALVAWVAAASSSARDTLLAAGLAGAALGLLTGLAWLTAQTTLYTVTSRRAVIRFGVAVPVTVNLPFAAISSAGLRAYADGTGDLALLMAVPRGLSWPVLWPHVRPWRLARPEPVLRAVPDAARAAQILARALASHAEQPAPAIPHPALPPGAAAPAREAAA